MGKSGDRKTTKTKKDKVQEKFGPGAIVKAKDKRKKVANLKKVRASNVNTCGKYIANPCFNFVLLYHIVYKYV